MLKKKYHGGLKVLLLPLFIMVLGLYSTCYANVTEDYITYLMESIRDEGTFLNNSAINKTYVTNFLNNTENITTLTNQLNTRLASHNWSNLGDYNLFATFQTSSSNIKIKFCFSNCTFPNGISDVGYTQFRGNYFGPYNSKNNLIVYLTLNNSVSYSEYFTTGTNEYYDYIDRHVNANYTTVYFENVYNRIPTQSVYILNAYNQLAGALLNDTRGTYQNNLPTEPEEPSGDTTTSGTGTITNTSGDTTGKIDLSGIEQGIGNIQIQISGDTKKVIENQNQNTDKVVGAINNANQNYWGTSGDLTGDEQEDIIKDSLNSLVSDVSGELHQNAVFEHLDSAENIFLNFFRNKQDESYYDLIISWDTISPIITMFNGSVTVANGQSIINGDSINISQLCRDNPELAKIQQYIRIIFNFGCLIALLWQIYNLILSTLGIDNPYLYEDADVTDVVNGDTGEVRTYYRTRKRYYKKR